MIEFTIRIEETEPGKFDVKSRGQGQSTAAEFALGEKIREAINQTMRREMADCENGTEIMRNGENHGRPVQ